jgi:hypothetical protein
VAVVGSGGDDGVAVGNDGRKIDVRVGILGLEGDSEGRKQAAGGGSGLEGRKGAAVVGAGGVAESGRGAGVGEASSEASWEVCMVVRWLDDGFLRPLLARPLEDPLVQSRPPLLHSPCSLSASKMQASPSLLLLSSKLTSYLAVKASRASIDVSTFVDEGRSPSSEIASDGVERGKEAQEVEKGDENDWTRRLLDG